MGKALIIAEKPSVAADIARSLGGFTKTDDYFESAEYVLSSAIGHLVELCLPSELENMKGKWTFAKLPCIPEAFSLRPIPRTEDRLRLLKKLMKRDDVDRLINACDAGREGELIFRYIVQLAGSKKPIQRLWLQSMTTNAIRDGFDKLRPGSDLEGLAQAAVCRSESDWLVGINGTRALTAFNSRNGGFQKTTVGRVQTPTLAVVVERDTRIKNFVSKAYWELHGTFGAKAGDYIGRWYDESFHRVVDKDKRGAEKDEEAEKRAERFWDIARAQAIQAKCQGKPGIVTEERKPSSQSSQLLYDLTSLQRDANSRLGLSAKSTLSIAQRLYERHKVLTYPRTDSRALPEDYIGTVNDVLRSIQGQPGLGQFATKILAEGWVKPSKRIFNNAKISDHHAIIPTAQAPAALDDLERRLYELVTKRFLSIFYPPAIFEVTTRITRVENEPFKTEGKILRDPGWLAVYGREEQQVGDDATPALVAVDEGETVATKEVELRSLQTKPPARYTEATLLSAMEGAGKLVEDEELRDAMAAKGLGTPATRAATIEGLLDEEYLRREGREITATPKAFALIELLGAIKIPALASPEMTGEWEYKLKQMEHGELQRETFMKEIVGLTQLIVERAKTFQEEGVEAKPLDFKSPSGDPMVETLRYYQTPDAKFQIRKVVGGRLLEPHEIQQLVEAKFIGPLQGFRSKLGRPFAAALKMVDETGKLEFVFEDAPGEKVDITGLEPLGKCPLCGGRVFETKINYSCENSFSDEPSCKFTIKKQILAQDITPATVTKILADKKSDLLTAFVSNKNRRTFKAFLVVGDEGKLNFEFPPRAEKPGGAKPGANGKFGAGASKYGTKNVVKGAASKGKSAKPAGGGRFGRKAATEAAGEPAAPDEA